MRLFLCTLPIAALVACGPPQPISVEQAMAQCKERAYAAKGPQVSIGVGVNSDGKTRSGAGIGLSSDYLSGRDPHDVYETCVIAKSGVAPTQPLDI